MVEEAAVISGGASDLGVRAGSPWGDQEWRRRGAARWRSARQRGPGSRRRACSAGRRGAISGWAHFVSQACDVTVADRRAASRPE